MISAVSMGVNILLNGIFIYVLGLGVIGAAAATVISKLLELVWSALEIFRKNDIIIERNLLLRPDNTLFKDMARTTAPVLGNMLVWGCGFTMYSVIMGHMSSDAVAANAIANIVKELLICICSGFSSGGAIIVGNELGRGELEKAKEYGAKLCKIAVVSGILTGILILLCIPFVSILGELTDTAKSYL